MDDGLQELRRRVANGGDWEDKKKLSEALRRSGAVEQALDVLEEAGCIPRRTLEALRSQERPWPWNDSDAHDGGNEWRRWLWQCARMDSISCTVHHLPDNSADPACRAGDHHWSPWRTSYETRACQRDKCGSEPEVRLVDG